MKHQMFVIYDSKANAYLQPWFLTTEAQAQRVFNDCVNDADHNFGRHPEDYTLFNIGQFNDATAEVAWNAPVTLGNGLQYVKTKKPDEQQDLWPKTVQPKDYDDTDRKMLAERTIEKCADSLIKLTDGENT